MTPRRLHGWLRAARAVSAVALTAGCLTYDHTEQLGEELTVCHSQVIEGVDVSRYQGATIDWNAVHASGREFAIARVGDGVYRDPTFARNWEGIRAAGMIRGAYLYFRPTISAVMQATVISDGVGRLGPGDLPVTIDVECMCPSSAVPHCEASYAGCASPATAAAVLRDLMARVTADTGKAPMIYTGAWFWNGSTYFATAVTVPETPLWVSGYTTGCVTVPRGWTDWRFWQYTDGTCSGCPAVGPVPGIGQDCDRNRFNGTLADLRAFAGLTTMSDAGVDAGADVLRRDVVADTTSRDVAGDTSAVDAPRRDVVAEGSARDVTADAPPRDVTDATAGDDTADAARDDAADVVGDDAAPITEIPHGGCGCEVPLARTRGPAWSLALALLAARRRRRTA